MLISIFEITLYSQNWYVNDNFCLTKISMKTGLFCNPNKYSDDNVVNTLYENCIIIWFTNCIKGRSFGSLQSSSTFFIFCHFLLVSSEVFCLKSSKFNLISFCFLKIMTYLITLGQAILHPNYLLKKWILLKNWIKADFVL